MKKTCLQQYRNHRTLGFFFSPNMEHFLAVGISVNKVSFHLKR
jgi:hypothetical protein